MDIQSKEDLIDILKNNIVNVKFTKADGSERVMRCTLREDIAVSYTKKTDKEKEKNDNIVPVWDLEKEAWRSFRFDSILEVDK